MIALNRFREIIHNPSGYIDEIRDQPLKEDILFFMFITIVGSILTFLSIIIMAIFYGQGDFPGPEGIPIMFLSILFLFIVDGFFLMLIISLIEHFFVLFTGEPRDFGKTMKSVIYASFIPVLFIWLPGVFRVSYSAFILIGAFSIITFHGIRIFHKKTNNQAAFVAIFTTYLILTVLWLGKVNLIGNIW
jgi:Yip1 domain